MRKIVIAVFAFVVLTLAGCAHGKFDVNAQANWMGNTGTINIHSDTRSK